VQALIERLLFLQQYGNALDLDVRVLVSSLFSRIEADLRARDPTIVTRRYRLGRRDQFMARLRLRIRNWLPRFTSNIKDRLATLGRLEGLRAYDTLVATLGTVDDALDVRYTPITESRMRAILNTEPFQGRVLADHGKRLGTNIVDRVSVQVRLGMVREESIDDIVRRIRGTKAGNGYRGGVMQTTTRDAQALVRTAVGYASNRGQLDTFHANADILDGVRYLATLDDRTTDICLSLDGEEWDLDDPAIVVPGRDTHYGCRSVLTPIIAWQRLGLPEPPIPDRMARDLSTVSDADLERRISARRRSGSLGKVTRVPSGQVASEWFRRQRPAVQNHMVGKGRADLFRRGEITLKDLITRDMRSVSLDALRN